jgi:D-alanyl-D-alanine carboxypeptidase/D-alanyl-D-alanine-endopeptidase (penicillin-binding protein 4)
MKKILFIISLFSFSVQVLANVNSQVNDAIAHLGRGIQVGVQVSTLSGSSVYSYNAHSQLTPASTLKIYTAEAALLYLGPQYTFSTRLLSSSTLVKQGVLQGDLYLEYSGDPTLTVNHLNQMIRTLKTMGVNQIQGNVYSDGSAYDQNNIPAGWNKNDLLTCWSAPINAVMINANCMEYMVSQTIHSYPARPIGESIANPELYSLDVVRSLLQKNNIHLNGSVLSGSVIPGLKLIAVHNSAPLTKLVISMLKKSDDVIAETIFKKLGEVYSHQSGSWKNGEAAVKAIIKGQLHVDISDSVLIDGSGLSHYNVSSPDEFVAVLRAAFYNRATSKYFIEALPVGGIDGTLKSRLKSYFTHGKVFAKTGTISGVNCLSGYLKTKHHGVLVFSIMINGFHGAPTPYRHWIDKVLTEIAES